ncbi:MAG TPA: hypothetical protein VLB89_05350 [Gaiellaceae bacterium]|nr:hypothetical protein [Gaiellaceae bacterium]
MRKLAVVLAAAAAAVVVAAVGRGAIPDGNTIHGCFKNDSGVLRVIDAAAGGTCNAKSETALDWVQTGSPGVQGSQGDRGADGTPGAGGPDGVSSYQIESAAGTTTGQGSAGDVVVQASCPSGTVPTGGGFDVPSSANVGVVYNDATSSTWRVEVAGDVGVTVTVYAVCVDKQQWEGA